MARKVITEITCDACKKKGSGDVPATVELTIGEDAYDLCEEHGERFRVMLGEALGGPTNTALSA
ncbi:hypothetical protein [Streptomyces ardesiacus]|uniref:hypothetical protein n=1 Tax=Streptomyces ardesiacus TaxID=285564 RepID=UPI00381AF71B